VSTGGVACMWSIEGVMNVLLVQADLQGSVCSWHDCVELNNSLFRQDLHTLHLMRF
jgi:hypothetical protein